MTHPVGGGTGLGRIGATIALVRVIANLLDADGRPVQEFLPDPSGGTFDAAGDFDRFIDGFGRPYLSGIDSDSVTIVGAAEISNLLPEVEALLTQDLSGPERRGLLRLQVIATAALRSGGSIKFDCS